jgi:nucleoside-diphosphate-sugar epimerase
MLLNRGAQVTVLDRLLPPDSYLRLAQLENHVHFVTGDILDAPFLKLLLERFPVDVVFHAAAQPIVSISNALPEETAQINIIGTYNVLEAIRAARHQPRLVFASSGAYYGATQTTEPIPEEAPPLPASNIYAPSKVAADLAVRCYARIYNLRAATCRWMNTYGPGDTNFSRIVPATIKRLMQGERALIDGTDGSNVLEALFVRDMCEAYLAVAERLDDDNVSGEAFNFGGGNPITLKDLVIEIIRAWNIVSGENLPEEPLITGPHVDSVKYLDISKARERLGWHPSTLLSDGLRETVAWYRQNRERIGI